MQEFSSTLTIGGQVLGHHQSVWIVAEMSANHAQDYGKAVEILHAAKECGACL